MVGQDTPVRLWVSVDVTAADHVLRVWALAVSVIAPVSPTATQDVVPGAHETASRLCGALVPT